MNKKQQTLNPEAAVEMVIKMQDRQTNAIEILSGLILQFEQINYVLHKIDDKTTPRLIQFHTLKNAVNPPFLGGFSIFNTVVA